MARSTQELIKEQLGDLMITNANLAAQLEAMIEQNKRLIKENDDLKAKYESIPQHTP